MSGSTLRDGGTLATRTSYYKGDSGRMKPLSSRPRSLWTVHFAGIDEDVLYKAVLLIREGDRFTKSRRKVTRFQITTD
jgi:hypothetical protein